MFDNRRGGQDVYVSCRQLRIKPCVRDTEPEVDETEQDQESRCTSPIRQKSSPCDKRHPIDATSWHSFLASQC